MSRGFLAGVLALSALYGGGYLSNFLTHRACERYAARTIAREFEPIRSQYPGFVVFTLPGATAHSARALQAAGLAVQPCLKTGEEFECFPWGDVEEPEWVAPYVLDLRWGYVSAPLAGHGNKTRFLCIFGLALPLDERGAWVT